MTSVLPVRLMLFRVF